LQLIRLGRWAGDRTLGDPLVLVLHVAYLFIGIGFVLSGAAAFHDAVPASAGLHAWTVGAMGTMTLAVMSRASLGHTGRALRAGWVIQAVYLLIVIAALIRIAGALWPASGMTAFMVSGHVWILAYLGFAVSFAPILLKTRQAS